MPVDRDGDKKKRKTAWATYTDLGGGVGKKRLPDLTTCNFKSIEASHWIPFLMNFPKMWK